MFGTQCQKNCQTSHLLFLLFSLTKAGGIELHMAIVIIKEMKKTTFLQPSNAFELMKWFLFIGIEVSSPGQILPNHSFFHCMFGVPTEEMPSILFWTLGLYLWANWRKCYHSYVSGGMINVYGKDYSRVGCMGKYTLASVIRVQW